MNPLALTLPAGNVVGHICGRCRRAQLERVRQDEPPEDSSLERATTCCICDCGAVKEEALHQFCTTCYWWYAFDSLWRRIGQAYKLGISNAVVWEVIYDELDYGEMMNALLAEIEA